LCKRRIFSDFSRLKPEYARLIHGGAYDLITPAFFNKDGFHSDDFLVYTRVLFKDCSVDWNFLALDAQLWNRLLVLLLLVTLFLCHCELPEQFLLEAHDFTDSLRSSPLSDGVK
jgi:hypothetical protein